MKVLKFGGSSVAKPERINQVADILQKYYENGEKFTVVFSAFGGVTDSLIAMCEAAASGNDFEPLLSDFKQRHQAALHSLVSPRQVEKVIQDIEENHDDLRNLLYGVSLLKEASPRTKDHILSFGERNSTYIITQALLDRGILSKYLDARRVIRTDSHFNQAKVDFKTTYATIKSHYAENPEVQIVTGFIGSNEAGITTTLGRGGSDYTAAILAAALEASAVEIWTDVDGVMTADPRKVAKAFSIKNMTYEEAMEMSHFGAKVIYPPTLRPALQKQIPLYIKNTFNPSFEGTLISHKKSQDDNPVKGVTSISKIAALTLVGSGIFGVPGVAARLFGALGRVEVNIILITQGSSEHSITFAIDPSEVPSAIQAIESAFEYEMQSDIISPVKVEKDLSVLAIVGENMRYRPGISGRLFQALGKNGINIVAIAQGSSELNISTIIQQKDEAKALNAIHEAFFLSDAKAIHLFLVGVGLIGKTLIKQIKQQSEFLKTHRGLDLQVVGLCNSKKMYFDENGIDLNQWEKLLEGSGEIMSMSAYVQKMRHLNLRNSIFVDNTSSLDVVIYYESILDASIAISTPNKIATSSEYLRYKRLKNIAALRNIPFQYETNVGAGLPVISTLKDLLDSGDQILKIEGVLSGTLSFIFNNYKKGDKFSDIVKKAQQLGYTEPDPRTDLSGLDVKRKLLILAREAGLSLEAEDIAVTSLLPQPCLEATSVEGFYQTLEEHNDYFESLRVDAAQDGKALRFVASLEGNIATLKLESVTPQNPLYTLDGSDNMIVFTTGRYKERPLVVRGPGAGAEVTAAGVFAEIITIGTALG